MQPILKATLAVVILQYLPLTLGSECTQSNATPYKDPNTEGCSDADIARDDTGCVKQYCANGGTAASLQTCFCLALNEGNCGGKIEERHEMPKQKRQVFSCSGSDKCYINPVDGGLFCLNTSTGDYVGESGDSGNVNTGAYTPAVGGSSTATATTTSASSTSSSTSSTTSSSSSTTTSMNSSSASQTTTGMSTGSSTAGSSTTAAAVASGASTTAVSSSTHTAGQARATAGAVLGFLGLAVGMAL